MSNTTSTATLRLIGDARAVDQTIIESGFTAKPPVSLGAVRRALDLIERHLVETAYETERFPAPHPSLLESMSIA